ncbi:CLUMA_CG012082, isoform A [Clunio marinus]|uniref:CLUMA_CG012082, isoform A n=1 Tax=Clunio marinus TaxID=568069 RepID=A0A1J1IFM8_9DIPT|nr:CLUMA_CG012082, isoform A [Clunio marinus]
MFKLLIAICFIAMTCSATPEEELHGVKYANHCEACKILATELQERLSVTGKTHEVLEFGYSLDDVKPKKKKEYKKSETRLIESLEDVCDQVLQYNIHKERKDSTRFAKGMSETFQTLHGLVNKGVKVELGIPEELWDKPSAEITQLKSQCETLLERYEPDIEEWYFNRQEEAPLIDFLCRDRVLAKKDSECLYEVLKPKGETDKKEKKSKKSSKKDKKAKEDEEEASIRNDEL